MLNDRQERFCTEYLLDLNQKQAYIRAGYSPKSAESDASRLMANAKVRARIAVLMAERSVRTGVSQDRVVRELARIAFIDPTKLVDFTSGSIKEDELTDDDRAALAGVRVKSGEDFTEREVKLCDKVKSLELLGKHLGLFTDNVNINGALPVIIDDIPNLPPKPPKPQKGAGVHA